MHESLYRSLYRIRRVEEEVARVYPTDKIKSPVHLSIGQEAVSVGICAALAVQDVVFGTYRGHALYLAKGGDLKRLVAELYGKATGCTKGKGGSMHLIAPDQGVMGTSAIVGTTIANAVGYAYALRYGRRAVGSVAPLPPALGHGGKAPSALGQRVTVPGLRPLGSLPHNPAIVASFFGDGASEEGVFAESLNFAVLKRLPLLFVCENNGYAIHTHQSRRQGKPAIWERACAHGLPAERLDGNDLFLLCERAREVVAHIRAGEGPWFLEVVTYRWKEHVGPSEDYHLGYRTREEAAAWIASDPLRQLGAALEPERRARLEAEVDQEIAAAFAFAEASPFPEPAALFEDVFKEEGDDPPIADCKRQLAEGAGKSAL